MALRYWVGGSGTWDTTSTANWAATSGGASGASAPTSADNAIFDASSGTVIATLGENVPCVQLDIRTFTGTLDFNNKVVNIAGNGIVVLRTDTGSTVTGNPIVNLTYAGSTGTRTIGTGATTEANSITVNITAGSDIVTTSASSAFKSLNFTGFAGTYTNTTRTIYGNLTISSGMTVTAGANATTFAATSGTQQITTNGKTLDFPVIQNSPGATVQLQDNLTIGSTRTYTLTAGTLDLSSGNRTLSTGLFNSNNSNTRSIAFGTGNITLTQNGATIWTTATSTGLTFTGTPTVNATYAGATGTRTISVGNTAGGSQAVAINLNVSAATDIVNLSLSSNVNNLTFTGFTGTAGLGYIAWGNLTLSAGMTISGSTNGPIFSATTGTTTITTNGVTFDRAMSFVGVGGNYVFQDALTMAATRVFFISNGTVRLKNGVTTTVGVFSAGGSTAKTLRSTLAGSQATLSQASGTVSTVNMTIQDINATGGATWNAFVDQGNVDAGNVDGWDFGISPVVGGAEYTYALRSFTQPRRF